MEQATKYLTKDNLQNAEFFKGLLLAIADQSLPNNINIQACLILKRNVTLNWSVTTPQIKELIKGEIVNLIAQLQSQILLKNSLEILYQILIKNQDLGKWPDFLEKLYSSIKLNMNNPSSLYALLCAYDKHCKIKQHCNSEEKLNYQQEETQFFLLIEDILAPLQSS